MLKLWEQVGSSLATRVLAASEPALVFWVWCAFWWVSGHGGWATYTSMAAPLFSDGAALLAAVVAAVIVIVVSGLIVQRASTPVLRLLEGYWPAWSPGRETRANAWKVKRDKIVKAEVDATPIGGLTKDSPPAVVAEVMKWNTKLQDFPENEMVLPTRIGNIIRAGERKPIPSYGLDPIIVWPQLWLALPEQVRSDVQDARARLDSSVAAFVWSVLAVPAALVAGTWWALLGVLVAALVAFAIWWLWIPAEARSYSTVLSAVFDTQRFLLYDALHLPTPRRPRDEPATGRDLTRWLRRRDIFPNAFAAPASPRTKVAGGGRER